MLSTLTAGPGTRLLGCLGAAQIDRGGNINSTVIPGRAFLVGSGGGNDVASAADEVVVVATLAPRRTVEAVPYVTSPGDRVSALVTDLGTFERIDGAFVLTAVPGGPEELDSRIERVRQRCGWELVVADEVAELGSPTGGRGRDAAAVGSAAALPPTGRRLSRSVQLPRERPSSPSAVAGQLRCRHGPPWRRPHGGGC